MITIREIQASDWSSVKNIYLEGISTGKATFQTAAPTWSEWDNNHLKKLRYVAVIKNAVAGWIALSPVSKRPVYAGVCEVSVYIGENYRGRQIGYKLLQHLIAQSETENIWTLQVSIFSENIQSIKLHEKAGFRIIGYREKIGQLRGVWYDNFLMERRSKKVGFESTINKLRI